MSKANTTPRRVNVESGIYRRPDGRLEIRWRDARGKLRWRVVEGKLKAARAALATEHAKRARGEHYGANPRLSFVQASETYWQAHRGNLRAGTQVSYQTALKHLRAHFGTQRLSHITPSEVRATSAQSGARGSRAGRSKAT